MGGFKADLQNIKLSELKIIDPKSFRANFIDETNNKYGALTVVGAVRRDSDRKTMWACQCECGRVIIVTGSDLRGGKYSSCGHLCDKKEDLTGQVFGRLRVIEEDLSLLPKQRADRMRHWFCQCECGSITSVCGRNIKNGTTMSCGCLKSKGENAISKILSQNNIPYQRQKKIEGCINPNTNIPLRFDFYVKNNYVIEYDGEQHFYDTRFPDRYNLETVQQSDEIKNSYCKNNNIPIIRIPYTHLKDIVLKDLLLETSDFIQE